MLAVQPGEDQESALLSWSLYVLHWPTEQLRSCPLQRLGEPGNGGVALAMTLEVAVEVYPLRAWRFTRGWPSPEKSARWMAASSPAISSLPSRDGMQRARKGVALFGTRHRHLLS